MPKIVTIIGATGSQGRSVASAFLSSPDEYHVRAVTRNPSSPAAQSLASQGAELVIADLNSLPSLIRAFSGSHIIFGVTDFAASFFSPATSNPADKENGQAAAEVEYTQGVNLALAASSTLDTLEHYIWSTLPTATGISNNQFSVPHFEGKARVDTYIRDTHPELLAKTTFLWVTFYASNYQLLMYKPTRLETADTYIQLGSWSGDTPITCIDVPSHLGRFITAIIQHPGITKSGGIVLAEVETLTVNEMLHIWGKVKGIQVKYVQVEKGVVKELWGNIGEEIGLMMEFWDAVRERSWTDASGRKVLTREDLGVTGLQGIEEAFRNLN